MPRSSGEFVSRDGEIEVMQQHQNSVNSGGVQACASHSSSVSADGVNGGAHAANGDDAAIPQSVKGAPEHLRPVIRKRQNSESARRSRQRRKVAAKAFYERFDDQCQRLAKLETKVATLAELVRRKREREADAEGECELEAEQRETPLLDENNSTMQLDVTNVNMERDVNVARCSVAVADEVEGQPDLLPPAVETLDMACVERYTDNCSMQQKSVGSGCGFGNASSSTRVGGHSMSEATAGGLGGVGLVGVTGPACADVGRAAMPCGQAGSAASSYMVGRDACDMMGGGVMRKAGGGYVVGARKEDERPHNLVGMGGAVVAPEAFMMGQGGHMMGGGMMRTGPVGAGMGMGVGGVGAGGMHTLGGGELRGGDVAMGAEGGQSFGFVDNELDQYFVDTGLPAQRLFSPC